MNDLTPYGQERWLAGSKWRPGLRSSTDEAIERSRERALEILRFQRKPFLTAADLVLLREMKVGL